MSKTDIPFLDDIAVQAVEFFAQNPPKYIDLTKFNLPFVIGSGNALNTGLIMFGSQAAVFADESNFKSLATSYNKAIESEMIQDAVIISASGEKDSVWEVELAKQIGLKTTLLTTKPDSSAAKIADSVYTYQSIAEPYTYNTSTYMGMILSATHESPDEILEYIDGLVLPKNFDSYEGYAFILPDAYARVCPMLDIKKDELFGPHLGMRAFSQGQARHAKFINRTPKELVISLTGENSYYGLDGHKLTLSLPKEIKSAGVMAITYYIVGKIQRSKPQYFKDNIEAYTKDYGPKAYGKNAPFDVIVAGNV